MVRLPTRFCILLALVILQLAVNDTARVNRNLKHHTLEKREATDPIVYPGEHVMPDEPSLDRGGPLGVPRELKPTPCSNNLTFCEEKDDYPRDFVRNLLRNQPKSIMQLFFNEEDYEEEDTADRFNNADPNEQSFCTSAPRFVYPTKAQSKEGFLEFIVNEGNFKQGVKVEACMNEEKPCNIPGSLSGGYVSHCVQKTVVRTLVVLNKNTSDPSGVVTKPFEFPSCCVCSVTFVGTHDRFGGSTLVKPPQQPQSGKSNTTTPKG